ncbi:hypothetical protein SMICM304S_06586 [Streptomyces microflavus]
MISSLVAQLKVDGGQFADNQTPPPDEQARGQLLRALASDAIRGALQRHFGVRIAFQNCHRVAVFPLDASVDDRLAKFTSVRGQLLVAGRPNYGAAERFCCRFGPREVQLARGRQLPYHRTTLHRITHHASREVISHAQAQVR